MALATYSDLIAAVPNWMARSDLTSRIPEFISLAESDFNRELKTRDMLVVNQNFVIAAEYVPVPAGFSQVQNFYINTNPRNALVFLPGDAQTTLYNASGIPKYYSIVGSMFRFAPFPNGSFGTTLVYYQDIPGLQANSTNWLMRDHPNLYLFNTLMQASLFVQDDQAAQKWLSAYQTELRSIQNADNEEKYSGTGMAVRASCTVA